MTFPASAGWGNLPNGNWSPIIFSRKAQIVFRKSSVVQAITNSDYTGEVEDYGDTVRIIKEPQLTVRPYTRGQQITVEELDDDELTLIIDQANYFAFPVDDIEKRHSHINWQSLASDNAGYQLRIEFDREVLNYMNGQVTTAQRIGSTSAPQGVGFANTTVQMTPLRLMNRIKRMLDVNNVPAENRWFVADPYYYELLADEDSKLVSRDYADGNIIRNGRVTDGIVRGFKLYSSNNLPVGGTGPTATSGSNYGVIMAGHMSSTATAEHIRKTESYRNPNSFGDIVRGMHLYGRKVLRPESLIGVYWNQRTA